MNNVIALIPARIDSSRLPGKALLPILDIPMVIHVAQRAKFAKTLDRVIVCTDSIQIAETCFNYKIDCCLTNCHHSNGTERIAEAARILKLDDKTTIVDIQGDEPLVSPESIDQLVINFINSNYDCMLPFIPFYEQGNKNIVKIVSSEGRVLFMSRSDIPHWFVKQSPLQKHLSIIAFKNNSLQKFATSPRSSLEEIESIELLRAIELGMNIGTFESHAESFSVDTKEDYERAIRAMRLDTLYTSYGPIL